MAKLDDLFKIMINSNASDLHLTSGTPPALRIHGDIQPLKYRPLTNDECQALIFEILNDDQIRDFKQNWELDCSYSVPDLGRFRCNVFQQRKGIGAVFRYIPNRVQTLQELNLPTTLREIIKAKKGLICVTGPTGSGKSTTLAAMIDHLNKTENAHILTVEDPIEFVHENKKSIINQREVRSHTRSFSSALKAALREDPDVILVGEMRDLETMQLAMTAAETGHLVFATLHTMSAPKTIDRIIDSFPEEQQAQIRVMLSESLRAVISQTLLKKYDGSGRVAALEIMVTNNAIQNLIREGKTFQIKSSMQTSAKMGMQTMEVAIEKLVSLGQVSKEEASPYLAKKTFQSDMGGNDNLTGGTKTPPGRIQMPFKKTS